MCANNLRRGLSLLRTEVKVLIWVMQSMLRLNKHTISFVIDCSDGVKMVSTPAKCLTLTILLEKIDKRKLEFSSCSITHIPRINNTRANIN